jgi:hypothetical protein
VDVHDGKVTVCRDFAKGKCTRPMCKYYHVPLAGTATTSSTSIMLGASSRELAAV